VHCPIDGETLLLTERRGVEIDYCPSCRGVWLDRGELDKLADAADRDADQPDGRVDERPQQGKPTKKKTSFLKDLFEFGQE
jgi:uncharacterized protein